MSKILYIENDKELTESFQEVVLDMGDGWQVEIVHHMAGAEGKIRGTKDYEAYVIDVMLPKNADELKKLESLELERLKKLDKLTGIRGRSDGDMERGFELRKEIDWLDLEIDKHLDKEGGIGLLKLICSVRSDRIKYGKLHLPVVFWTARSAPELKRSCEELVDEKFLGWIEKPEDEEFVYDTIKGLLEAAQRKQQKKERNG